MLKSLFIEDVFIEFFKKINHLNIHMPNNEYMACSKFYDLCSGDEQFTEKQAKYIVTLLKKYRSKISDEDFDYKQALIEPKFKKNFRVLDETKKAWISKDHNDSYVICLQFPYSLKQLFDEEIEKNLPSGSSKWDYTNRIRTLDLYTVNFLSLFSFLTLNDFFIDESIYEFSNYIENLYENEILHLPRTHLLDDDLVINFLNEESKEYFEKHRTNDYHKDIFLAKLMGYPLTIEKENPNTIEQISNSKKNMFWIRDYDKFFDLYKSLGKKICIILDRNIMIKNWIEDFVKSAEGKDVNRKDIKVCFRADKTDDTGLNQWIKDNNLGGPVADGKIFIFCHKPAKWIFKDETSCNILVLTNITPMTNSLDQEWIETHPCVIYLTDIKPTLRGKKQVVEL